MKFIKKLATNMVDNWQAMNEEQKLRTFDLMWEGHQIPNNRLINRLKEKLPGVRYKEIYVLVEKVLVEGNIKDVERLEKELNSFYSTPIIKRHETYYPEFKAKIYENLYPLNKAWLKEIILPDLKECEELQRNRLLKRYGLPYNAELLNN